MRYTASAKLSLISRTGVFREARFKLTNVSERAKRYIMNLI